MSKTSTKEQVQEIDPDLRAESEALMSLGRDIAGLGYNPYEGNTIADFTNAQNAAFANADAGASAFGMTGGLVGGGPTGATTDQNNIAGFSPYEVMMAQNPNSQALLSDVQNIYQTASMPTDLPGPKKVGGGKK